MKTVIAYIGLGSNLNAPVTQLCRAVDALSQIPNSILKACSSFYSSDPMGPQNQPDYVNAVAAIDTGLDADQVLTHLQTIETQLGRQKNAYVWGPRVIDLDLLLVDQYVIHSARLTLPHSKMHERDFVLYPLLEIAPDIEIPGKPPVTALLQACHSHHLHRLENKQSSFGCVSK